MTGFEAKYNYWQWEEDIKVLNLEHVGFRKIIVNNEHFINYTNEIFFVALIILGVGSAFSLMVFILEFVIFNLPKYS